MRNMTTKLSQINPLNDKYTKVMSPLRNCFCLHGWCVITLVRRVTTSFSSMLIAKIIIPRMMKHRAGLETNSMRYVSTLVESFWFFPFCLTFEITNTVVVRVHKTARINLIDNCVVPPSSVEDFSRDHSDRQQQT